MDPGFHYSIVMRFRVLQPQTHNPASSGPVFFACVALLRSQAPHTRKPGGRATIFPNPVLRAAATTQKREGARAQGRPGKKIIC